jgi:hypothetical protein
VRWPAAAACTALTSATLPPHPLCRYPDPSPDFAAAAARLFLYPPKYLPAPRVLIYRKFPPHLVSWIWDPRGNQCEAGSGARADGGLEAGRPSRSQAGRVPRWETAQKTGGQSRRGRQDAGREREVRSGPGGNPRARDRKRRSKGWFRRLFFLALLGASPRSPAGNSLARPLHSAHGGKPPVQPWSTKRMRTCAFPRKTLSASLTA